MRGDQHLNMQAAFENVKTTLLKRKKEPPQTENTCESLCYNLPHPKSP
jgi:hypothetical protein